MTEPPNPVSLGVTQILHDLSMLQDRQIATQHTAQATLETVAPLTGLLALLDPPDGEAQELGCTWRRRWQRWRARSRTSSCGCVGWRRMRGRRTGCWPPSARS